VENSPLIHTRSDGVRFLTGLCQPRGRVLLPNSVTVAALYLLVSGESKDDPNLLTRAVPFRYRTETTKDVFLTATVLASSLNGAR
jgi:hypothetical protein